MHRAAKGTFATFERARTRRGRGGDPASGASSACLAQPGQPATAQRNARAGEERRGLGARAPRPPGGLSELGCDAKMFIATWLPPSDSCSSRGRGEGRDRGDFRDWAAGLGDAKGAELRPGRPAGDPGRKPARAQAWRELPGRDEGPSRSSEPSSPSSSARGSQLPGWGRAGLPAPPSPAVVSPRAALGGVAHLLWGWSLQGGRRARGSTLPHSGIILPQTLLS